MKTMYSKLSVNGSVALGEQVMCVLSTYSTPHFGKVVDATEGEESWYEVELLNTTHDRTWLPYHNIFKMRRRR